jgi:hypothetical protein
MKPNLPTDVHAWQAPSFDRPDCIEGPGGMPTLDPRRMPQLRLACPSQDGKKRSRAPLWRSFKAPGE